MLGKPSRSLIRSLPPRIPACLAGLLLLAACQKLEPECDIRPHVTARDTTVAAFDTVLIRAESRDACGGALRYLWSFDGGMHYDTTSEGSLERVFARSETGVHRLRIRVLTDQGRVSSPAEIRVTVEERRFPYRLPPDTLHAFADTSVAIDLSPAEPVAGIAWYCLSLGADQPCVDSSRTPIIRIARPASLHGPVRLFAELRLASGARSETASVDILLRPRLLPPPAGIAAWASLSSGSLVRFGISYETGADVPGTGRPARGARLIEVDLDGDIVKDARSAFQRDLGIAGLVLQAGGEGLLLGRDGLDPAKGGFLAVGLDPGGQATWEKRHVVDTSYLGLLQGFPGVAGAFRVVASSHASTEPGNGKPATAVATALHFIDLARDGSLITDKRVLVNGLQNYGLQAERLPDGGFAVTGMGQRADGDLTDLWVLRHDAAGEPIWKKVFSSEAGSSRADRIVALAEGSLLLIGRDFASPMVHWILRLDEKGNQAGYRLLTPPAGFGVRDVSVNSQGTLLFLMDHADQGGMLWALDYAGREKWRRAFAKSQRSAYLGAAMPLPDGGFLVTGTLHANRDIWSSAENFLFRVSAEGAILW